MADSKDDQLVKSLESASDAVQRVGPNRFKFPKEVLLKDDHFLTVELVSPGDCLTEDCIDDLLSCRSSVVRQLQTQLPQERAAAACKLSINVVVEEAQTELLREQSAIKEAVNKAKDVPLRIIAGSYVCADNRATPLCNHDLRALFRVAVRMIEPLQHIFPHWIKASEEPCIYSTYVWPTIWSWLPLRIKRRNNIPFTSHAIRTKEWWSSLLKTIDHKKTLLILVNAQSFDPNDRGFPEHEAQVLSLVFRYDLPTIPSPVKLLRLRVLDPRPEKLMRMLDVKFCTAGGSLQWPCNNPKCEVIELFKTSSIFKLCSGCKVAGYCSEKCQHKHWPIHQQYCCQVPKINDSVLIQAFQGSVTHSYEKLTLTTNHEVMTCLFNDTGYDVSVEFKSEVMLRGRHEIII